jgi:hypothetical protein
LPAASAAIIDSFASILLYRLAKINDLWQKKNGFHSFLMLYQRFIDIAIRLIIELLLQKISGRSSCHIFYACHCLFFE